jgi:hypothetical protein
MESMSKIGKVVDESAWRANQLGWYLFRIGKVSEAKDKFTLSQKLYDIRHYERQGAEPGRNLLLVALVNGDIPGAVKTSEDLARRNPRSYAPGAFIDEVNSWSHERWFQDISVFYRETLPRAFEDFVKLLTKRNQSASVQAH